MPDTDLGTLLVEAIVCPRIVKTVRRHARCRPRRQLLHVRRITQADLAVLTGLYRQPFDLFGHQHGPAEGLREQATVVIAQHRHVRHQLTDFDFSGREAHFCRHPGTAEIVCGAPIAAHRQQLRTTGLAAAVELDAEHGNAVHPKPDNAWGKARTELEDKALRPLIDLAFGRARVTKVAVEVVIAQQQIRAGIFKKALILRHDRGAQGQRQQANGVLHYYCSPFFGRSRSPQLKKPAQLWLRCTCGMCPARAGHQSAPEIRLPKAPAAR